MTIPSNRVPVRIARGTYANLLAAVGSLPEGEIVYAKDEDRLYVVEGATLIAVNANLGNSSIDALSDVDTTSTPPTIGQGLSFDGANWVPTTVLTALDADTTPQLGGNLDVNGNQIVSASNGNIIIAPDGNGVAKIAGNATGGAGALGLTDEAGGNTVYLESPAAAAVANYTLVLPTTAGAQGESLTKGAGNALEWVEYVPLIALQTETAAATDFADFQARIAAL